MKKVYVLIFDGLADWEAPLALCEVRNSGKFEVVTVGLTDGPVTTMAGFRLLPDVTLPEVSADGAALLVLPGGERWEAGTPDGGSSSPPPAIWGTTSKTRNLHGRFGERRRVQPQFRITSGNSVGRDVYFRLESSSASSGV